MKKYRLIEYDPTKGMKTFLDERYNCRALAEDALFKSQDDKPQCFYRIEEVEGSIMDRVKSYEDACKIIGEESFTKVSLYGFKYNEWTFVDELPDHIIALLKLETITAALNEGWKPDWENQSQKKWTVWYSSETEKCKASDQSVCCMTSSRLYFKSRDLAEYAASQFAELYRQLLIEAF